MAPCQQSQRNPGQLPLVQLLPPLPAAGPPRRHHPLGPHHLICPEVLLHRQPHQAGLPLQLDFPAVGHRVPVLHPGNRLPGLSANYHHGFLSEFSCGSLLVLLTHERGAYTSDTIVTAPILRVPEEGTLGAEKHLEAHLDKLPEGSWCKGCTPLVGFRPLDHPLSHLGVLAGICLLVCSPHAMALHQPMSLSLLSSAQARLRLQPVSSLNSSSQMYVSDYLTSYNKA
jgi:hypothetical protein